MKAISLKNIAYEYAERPIFTDVNLKCVDSERLCILGENGAGKSTLLKIIVGQISLDSEDDNGVMSGTIEKTGHIRSVYVPQEFPHKSMTLTVDQYIEKEAAVNLTKKVYAIAKELGFDAERAHDSVCGSFSGGQQKILALATAFASSPDFLLLDEPENHIDIVSRVVLIRMLNEFRGGIIFISHDRLLIDSISTKVAELARGEIHVSEGTYDDYIEDKMQRIGGMQRAYDAETKRIKQLETAVVIMRQKAIRGKEVSAYHKKKAELDELKKAHKETGRPDDKKTAIKLSGATSGLHGGKLLCRVKDGSFRYEGQGRDLFRDVSLEVRSGAHIALLGRNGAGKSSFLKCLTGEHAFTEGETTWAEGVKWAYFDQHMKFDSGAKPVEIVMEKLNCFEVEARAALGAMRFDLKKMNTPIEGLSGGERMRLRFALVFGAKPDFLILDEPTNHIDEVTWEVLLFACKQSKSTILLVSHDYEFIQEFGPSVFWMIQGQSVVPRYKELGDLLEEMGGGPAKAAAEE
ncbi:MAG TPA: ABC-F family ATP-binding cassette domain-containing protein [Candidatus Paceibacterota bacterium]